ncbi:MAG: phosphoribosylaminoimidazolesuccinocarboxamide synthase [Bacteroidales bacterium]|nr:phosphoribosylaminoimidazolesuccinocarboxamide synthase [Candidatus Cacconaster merdequi]
MSTQKLIYDGKEKQVFETAAPGEVLIHFKDDITAYDGIKKAEFPGKGALNCEISSLIFEVLSKEGIRTHFIRKAGERDILCRKVKMIPVFFIVRNYIAGTTAAMLGLEDGFKSQNVVYELKYDNEGLGNPLLNRHHAVALGLLTYEELDATLAEVSRLNEVLVELFTRAGIKLIDYRIEMGRADDGSIIVADEISPDTSRMWDAATDEKLDKDRFRFDLGFICDNYRKILDRLKSVI